MVDLTLAMDAVLGTFAEDAELIRAATQAAEDIVGVFDSRHFPAEVGGEVTASVLETTLLVRTALGVVAGDHVRVRSVDYLVRDLRPDAEGAVALVLERAA
jgi:hypothetical protein